MATATARTPDSGASIEGQAKGVNRREFLQYVWGASIALLLTESCGAITWFALPHEKFGFGQDSDLFKIDLAIVPALNAAPEYVRDGKFWLSYAYTGLLALSGTCVHDMTSVKWVPTNNRFECPKCGSKFWFDGTRLIGQGPAQRNLDRFVIQVTTSDGIITTPPDGSPVNIKSASQIIVAVDHKILGKPQ